MIMAFVTVSFSSDSRRSLTIGCALPFVNYLLIVRVGDVGHVAHRIPRTTTHV